MRRVLAHRDFRLLWLGQALSALGDRIILVALVLFVNDIGTPTDVGLVLAANQIPFLALLLFGGVWADRLPRHRLMVVTDLARFALHALLALLILTGDVAIWQIMVIEALFGASMAFFRPAYTGLLPQTVPEEDIQAAQALTGITHTSSQFLGPAIGTALVLGLGAGWAFALDALTFLVSAALLLQMRPRTRGDVVERTSFFTELAEGWQAVRSRTWVWAIIAASSLILLLVIGPFSTLGPSAAEELYGEAGVFGGLMAAFGAGTLLGSLSAARWRPVHPLRTAQLFIIPYSVSVVAFALEAPLGVVGALFIAGGFGVGVFEVWWETAMAEHIPPHLLSRVGAYDWMGSMALLPLGYVLAGPLGEAVGGPEVLLVGALAAVVVEVAVLFVPSVWGLKSGIPSSVVDASA